MVPIPGRPPVVMRETYTSVCVVVINRRFAVRVIFERRDFLESDGRGLLPIDTGMAISL